MQCHFDIDTILVLSIATQFGVLIKSQRNSVFICATKAHNCLNTKKALQFDLNLCRWRKKLELYFKRMWCAVMSSVTMWYAFGVLCRRTRAKISIYNYFQCLYCIVYACILFRPSKQIKTIVRIQFTFCWFSFKNINYISPLYKLCIPIRIRTEQAMSHFFMITYCLMMS